MVDHSLFNLTAVRRHMLQQDLNESIDVNMESDASNNSYKIDMESDTSNDGDKEHESGDEDDIANKLQNRGVEGELSETSNTYYNHGMNDCNMIGRQEKLDEVFNTEKKLQWNF